MGRDKCDFDADSLDAMTAEESLSKEEQRALCTLAQAGDTEARHRLIETNTKLVVAQVKKFCTSTADPRFHDLFQAGIVGFLTAIDKFDLSKDVAVSTYAVWWIKAKVRDELQKTGNKVLRFKSLYAKFRTMRYKLYKEFKCDPRDSEVFARLEWDDATIKKFITARDTQLVSIHNLDQQDIHSGKDMDNSDTGERVLSAFMESEQLGAMYAALQELDETTRGIIMRHYGLGYDSTATYDQLSEIFQMTREKVRMLENQGLRQVYFSMEFPELKE